MKQSIAVVGLQWGDEGKARVIDFLSEDRDYVARFQGGGNAGHTVVVKGEKYVFHLIPSGMLHDECKCFIGQGVVVNPWDLKEEVEDLKKRGLSIGDRLCVSPGCHLVMPYHQKLDLVYENLKGASKVGTTGRGIGPCYSDKALRHGIRAVDLTDANFLRKRLEVVLPIQNALLSKLGGEQEIELDELLEKLLTIGKWLTPFLRDVPDILNKGLDTDKKILFEGAQSVMLDIDCGTYPFVTSSNSSLAGLFAGCGVNPARVDEIWGVSKVYCTRVGAGPFATEDHGDDGEMLRERGGEFGATTGRPRRCGWLDLPLLKYSTESSGITHLALTKLDVLTGLKKIKVCTHYDGQTHRVYHTAPNSAEDLHPHYEEVSGWSESLDGVDSFDKLPDNAKKLIKMIEEYVGLPVRMLTVGPSREQTILP